MAGEKRKRLRGLLRQSGEAVLRQLTGKGTLPEGPQEVRFEENARGLVAPGTTLLQAALALDVELDHFCGGHCSCGTCRLEILDGADHLTTMRPSESIVLGHEAVEAGDRLGCQAGVLGPVEVRIPDFFMRGA